MELSTDDRPSGDRHVNVLITAAGRRTSLVKAFATEVHRRGGRVYAGDVDALAPALYFADDVVRTLRTDDPAYIRNLLDAVTRHEIGLVIPTIDGDLPVLSAAKKAFLERGCQVAVSDPAFVATTLDKQRTGAAFGAAGIHVPWSWLPPIRHLGDLPPMVFVKPRRGSASQDLYTVPRERLDSILDLLTDPVVQEVLTGPEITIDALLDLKGTPIHYVPRLRIRTLGGESVQGVTLDHDDATEAWITRLLRICSRMGAVGPLTIQAFLGKDDLVLSEINPRFGGGFPLALAAGAMYPAWLLDMVEGRPIAARLGEYEAGLYMTRYNVEHFTRHPKW